MYEELFRIAGLAAPVWLLLILLPKFRLSRWLAGTMAAPLFLGLLYVWGVGNLIAARGLGFMRDFGSLDGVLALLTDPAVAVVAWIHILAFDHAVGVMIYRENMERRFVSLPVQSVLLLFTFMLGPVGFVSYWLIRGQRLREASRPLPVSADVRAAESAPVRETSGLGTLRELGRIVWLQLRQEPVVAALGALGVLLGAVLLVVHVSRGGAPIPPEGNLMKPVSFDIGVGIYLLTLAIWLPSAGFGRRSRLVWITLAVITALYAYGIESVQALRGLDPRFSAVAGARDQMLGGMFFLAANVIVGLFLVIAWRLFRPDRADARSSLMLAMRYAAVAVVFGFVAGYWMSAASGRTTGSGGNLILMHAVGFHGLQAIPVVALLLAWRGGISARGRLLVHGAGAGWLLACAGVAWQAYAGQPPFYFGAPNVLTIVGLLVWAACGLTALASWWRAGRHVPLPASRMAVPSLAQTLTGLRVDTGTNH